MGWGLAIGGSSNFVFIYGAGHYDFFNVCLSLPLSTSAQTDHGPLLELRFDLPADEHVSAEYGQGRLVGVEHLHLRTVDGRLHLHAQHRCKHDHQLAAQR